ncbi:MAG: hypothetical protein QOI41_6248 [Myxococcales bacterium]|nr:hypothetical protein [Myxococcales bacterium]
MKKLSTLFGAIVSVVVASSASCATKDDGAPPADVQDASLVPETSTAPDLDASSEAGCDAASSDCTTEVARCENVAWCAVPTNVSVLYTLAAVWGTSAADVWAVGSGGTIIHYDGATWTATPSGLHETFYGVWGSGPNDVYAVSSTQVILHGTGYAAGKATWNAVPTSLDDFSTVVVRAVWGSSSTDVRIGGRAYSLDPSPSGFGDQFVKTATADGGIAWRPLPGTPSITSIWGSSANDVWMAADNSTAAAYERGMTLHGTPAVSSGTDAGAEGGAPADDDRLTWTPVDSQSAVTLESVWGSSASDVWAVGALGTIRHITPQDVRWQEVPAPTTETLHAIWGSGPKDIWAVGNAGTILHYDGVSFQPSTAQFPIGRKPKLNGIWGSGPNDVWIVGDGVALHYTGPKPGVQGGDQ